MPAKPRMARYHFNLCIERIQLETRLGKNKKCIHADLKKEGLFNYSYISFFRYFKENMPNMVATSREDIPTTKTDLVSPKEKEKTGKKAKNMVEVEKRQDDEENELTNKYI